MDGGGKRPHVSRTLSTKLVVLERLKRGAKIKDLMAEFKIPRMTISTWRAQAKSLQDQANEGVKLDRKRNRASTLPQVERALLLWFRDIRMRAQSAPLSNQMLEVKAEE